MTSNHDIEQDIIARIINDAIYRGYSIDHHNGEHYTIAYSRNVDAIMSKINQCDEESLIIRDHNLKAIGGIQLIYGNDGHDVIADHSDNDLINELLTGALELAEEYSNA